MSLDLTGFLFGIDLNRFESLKCDATQAWKLDPWAGYQASPRGGSHFMTTKGTKKRV